jgi:metallophosphoesterase (TIGR00282 family)
LKVLFIGDIIGKPGRHFLKENLPGFRRDNEIDLCIANAENGSGGFGLTPDSADTLFASGIDVITSGNHIWDRKVVMPYLDNQERLLRPANYPPGTPGKGELLFSTSQGIPVGIINLQGRAFMPAIDCPFRAAETPLTRLKKEAKIVIVDFHAEATAEKLAMGWFLAGKVSAVVGTHTHVQTADERMLEGGTAYITDVGMTGSIDGVIGMRKKEAIQKFLTQLPRRFVPATGDVRMMAVCIDIDEMSGKAVTIERINHS